MAEATNPDIGSPNIIGFSMGISIFFPSAGAVKAARTEGTLI
jgi:hypothetical protein